MTHQKHKTRESKQRAMGMIALKGRKELEWKRKKESEWKKGIFSPMESKTHRECIRYARLKNAEMRLQEASIRNRTKHPVRSFFRDCLARIAKTIGWNRS